MLNIFNLKLKNNLPKDINVDNTGNDIGRIKHFPPATKEWSNSIYAYNKGTIKLLPIADKVVGKLIKSYFNLYSVKLEKKIKSRRLRIRFRRLSTNRILVSKAEFKHTSDKVIITVHVYNRQKNYYLNKMIKVSKRLGLNKRHFLFFMNKLIYIKKQTTKVISKVRKEKNLLLKTLKWKDNNFRSYEDIYCKNFIKRSLEREILYLYYKEILFFNKSKFNNTNLLKLIYILEKVYNKKVEFNIVNLKYLHLNSHIFSETILTKLKNRKNRLLRVLKTSLSMVKLPSFNKLTILNDISIKDRRAQNLNINSSLDNIILLTNKSQYSDRLDVMLAKLFPENFKDYKNNESTESTVNIVLNSIKHKSIGGIRLEAAGRLSRRITAARSVFKIKYIGNIKNIDSSYKGFSSVILRGNTRSNIQFTKLASKNRIGSFGLKGWISSR